LAVLDLDYFKKINDRYGHLVGDRVLRDVASNLANEFRSQDVVARWGGEEFLVATFGMTKKDTTRRLALALERLTLEGFLSDEGEEFRVSFSAGVAEFPEDGQSLMELYKAADGALYRAKEEGRCRVIPVNFPRDRFSPTSVDVLLVEHDHPLGCVLVDAIRRVNLSVIWCSTGEEALSRAQTGVSFRLLLVDQDLPGATGLQILQEMLLLKLTEHAQVLMVTSNMSQEQLLQMFDLGVDDHISKPFFLPVIVRHILRVFEERSSCRSR
jgi:diguanylate cyclase (GGDEF)-like protein